MNMEDIIFYDAKEAPFDLYGFYSAQKGDFFRRIPEDVARKTSEGVYDFHTHTTGGRVRFRTDSPYVAILTKLTTPVTFFQFMSAQGAVGFDLYVDNEYAASLPPSAPITDGYDVSYHFRTPGEHDVLIHFPLYANVKELHIGIHKSCSVMPGEKYLPFKPIAFYGSSITQGGNVSRPGNIYPAILSRRFGCDFINLGFSGRAKAERAINDYIASLDMSCFVMDYDHNAPTPEYLQETHAPFFRTIRKAHPDLPIILLSMPFSFDREDVTRRKEIIRSTYLQALENGDQNVRFIDGESMFELFGGTSCTSDGCHPNDLGFMCMAKVIGDCIDELGLFGQ